MTTQIKATAANRKILRSHAKEAMADYSAVMTWLVLEDGDLYEIINPQGQTFYTGNDFIIATTGGFHKSCGEGAVTDEYGNKYKTQKSYLSALLGKTEYERIFLPRQTMLKLDTE